MGFINKAASTIAMAFAVAFLGKALHPTSDWGANHSMTVYRRPGARAHRAWRRRRSAGRG